MSSETARQAAVRIRDHLIRHEKTDCSIVLHGGEPLMGGLHHLSSIVEVLLTELTDHEISATLGIQSNGMLFDREIGDFLRLHGMTIGVSLDGPPEVNDRYRVDHQGRPTTERLEPRLRTLTEDYSDVFSGFLCVIDPFSDPVEVTKYLLSYKSADIDFLYPLNNHSVLPRGKSADPNATPYGDWLVAAYDYWSGLPDAGEVRIFRSIINMWLGLPTLVESLGLFPVDLVVIETNGEIEAVDSLKAAYQGATELGFDVFRNAFDEVAAHGAVLARQSGVNSLCEICRQCEIVDICGGGYIPHRYSASRGFANPSVYCTDLKRLINHIGRRILNTINSNKVVYDQVTT